MCKSVFAPTNTAQATIGYVETGGHEDTENIFISEISIGELKNKLEVCGYIRGVPITFKLDTGADTNVISNALRLAMVPIPGVEPSPMVLSTYTKEVIKTLGCCKLECTIGGISKVIPFMVTVNNYMPILGGEACTKQYNIFSLTTGLGNVPEGVSRANEIIQRYAEVFREGIGVLPGEHHITLEPGATPVVHAARKVPFALMKTVRDELDRLVSIGVIAAVSTPTDWVHPMVVVHKPNGGVRICIDPGELNRVIKRPHYKMPTLDEVTAKLNGARVFTVLDSPNAFLHKRLDEESSWLCTFATPYGRYRFLRLPYGIATGSEVYQQEMVKIFGSQQNADVVIDDLIVHGRTEQEHDSQLEKVLDIAKQNDIRFSRKKLQLAKKKVRYLGHIFSEEGVCIDPSRIAAIQDIPPPKNVKELQRMLGMFTYLVKFIPHASDKMAPLRCLLKKTSAWDWNSNHDKSLGELKNMVAFAPVLRFYQSGMPLTLSVDASPVGLGAHLEQAGGTLAYASTCLTDPQTRYSQIEKELLAVVYGLEHFHQYVYGNPITVFTDHKPLVTMIHKTLGAHTPRIQRLFMRLQRYTFNILFKPGKEMWVADTLSRSPQKGTEFPTPDEEIQMIAEVNALLPIDTNQRIEEVRQATALDQGLQGVIACIQEGWPDRCSNLPVEARPYWQHRNVLSTHQGLVLMGLRVAIPNLLRDKMIERLHEVHQGITLTRARARRMIFWPGLSRDIEKRVMSCTICEDHQARNPRKPLIPHHIPKVPWRKVAVDFFDFQGHKFIEIIDYYSKYPEVHRLVNLTGSEVVNALKSAFARHGIPDEIVSDGGPPFLGHEFQDFIASWQISHTRTSPDHPQSNGEVERAIQTTKRTYAKCLEDSRCPYLALLTIRTSPVLGTNISPDQLLMGRRLQTRMPDVQLDSFTRLDELRYRGAIMQRQQDMCEKYSVSRKTSTDLPSGRVKYKSRDGRWRPGWVIDTRKEPRSVVIDSDQGTTVTRNAKDVRRSVQPKVQLPMAQGILFRIRTAWYIPPPQRYNTRRRCRKTTTAPVPDALYDRPDTYVITIRHSSSLQKKKKKKLVISAGKANPASRWREQRGSWGNPRMRSEAEDEDSV